MSDKIINHDLRVVNGGTIAMPAYIEGETGWGNLAIPNVYATPDSIQQYPIGTAFREGERVYRYVKYGDDDSNAAGAGFGTGVEAGMLMSITAAKIASASVTTATAGATTITVKFGVDVTVNQLAGGYTFFSGIGSQWGCRVIGNTVALTGVNCVITLEQALPTTRVAISGTNFSVCKSPWKDVVLHGGTSNEDYASAVGVYVGYSDENGQTLNVATEGKWGWIQTWGPTHMQANAFGGNATGERGCWAMNKAFTAGAADTLGQQYLGFLLHETVSGTNDDMPIVWLQICP